MVVAVAEPSVLGLASVAALGAPAPTMDPVAGSQASRPAPKHAQQAAPPQKSQAVAQLAAALQKAQVAVAQLAVEQVALAQVEQVAVAEAQPVQAQLLKQAAAQTLKPAQRFVPLLRPLRIRALAECQHPHCAGSTARSPRHWDRRS